MVLLDQLLRRLSNMSQGLADGGDLRLERQVNASSGFTQAISFAAKAMRVDAVRWAKGCRWL